MKKSLLILALFSFSFTVNAETVGEKIVKYCKSQMGKKIDRGECWDLVSAALNYAGATWNKYDVYGTVYDPKKEKIKVGDVIEMHNAKFEFEDGTWMKVVEHYAIVYEVKEDNKITIVHQNHNNIRKVQTLDLDLDGLTSGKLIFYRPS